MYVDKSKGERYQRVKLKFWKIHLAFFDRFVLLSPRLNKVLLVILPLVFYASLSLLYFANQQDWKSHYYGYSSDPMIFVWFLNWWPFAILHGLNPFITKYIWYPAGFNLSWATSIPFLAFFFWPVTIWQGPVFSYNVLTLAAPACAAWSAYLLCRAFTRNVTNSLIGGYVFGFSSYEMGTMMTALNLDTIFLVPLAILLCLYNLRDQLKHTSFIICFSLVLIAQLGISTEVLASSCLVGAITLAIFFAFSSVGDRLAVWRLIGDICGAAGLTIILAAPFFYYLICGLPDIPKFINSPVFASADIWNFLVPNSPTSTIFDVATKIGDEFRGYAPYKNAYLGLPLIVATIWYFLSNLDRKHVRAFAATTVTIVVLSLGPVLHENAAMTHIWMPWTLVTYLPVMRSILPVRLIVFTNLCAAVALALWLTDADSGWQRSVRFAIAGAACLFLIPNRPHILSQPWRLTSFFVLQRHFLWSPWPEQAFFTPSHIRQALGIDKNVILLPVPSFGPGMAWQVNAGLSFRQVGGYVGLTPVSQQAWKVLTPLVFGPPEENFKVDLMSYCYANHVDYILIGPDAAPGIVEAIHTLKLPSHVDDGIEVIEVEE